MLEEKRSKTGGTNAMPGRASGFDEPHATYLYTSSFYPQVRTTVSGRGSEQSGILLVRHGNRRDGLHVQSGGGPAWRARNGQRSDAIM